MGETVWTLDGGNTLEFDQGALDENCVYEVSPNGTRVAPRDVDYFAELLVLANTHGTQKVYDDFVQVYEAVNNEVSDDALRLILDIARTYGADFAAAERLLIVLYMAMIAEERKANTRLGKRIKRLGVHSLLFEDHDPREAADFMRGMKWQEISSMCEERDF